MAGKNETGVRYKDKVTMVTGGSRGLGRAIVETFGEWLSSIIIIIRNFNFVCNNLSLSYHPAKIMHDVC